MAIPTDYFRTKYGIAVMRYTAGEWFFECWATKSTIVRDLPAGTHTFALWLICGDLAGVAGLTFNAWSAIYAMKARR